MLRNILNVLLIFLFCIYLGIEQVYEYTKLIFFVVTRTPYEKSLDPKTGLKSYYKINKNYG